METEATTNIVYPPPTDGISKPSFLGQDFKSSSPNANIFSIPKMESSGVETPGFGNFSRDSGNSQPKMNKTRNEQDLKDITSNLENLCKPKRRKIDMSAQENSSKKSQIYFESKTDLINNFGTEDEKPRIPAVASSD